MAQALKRERSNDDIDGESASKRQDSVLDAERQAKLIKAMKAVMVLNYAKIDSKLVEVIPGLYIGSIGAALNKKELTERGVSHVLCVADGIRPPYPEICEYRVIEISDSPGSDLLSHFEPCFEFIEKGRNSGGVLVHCFAGKSRSATIIVGFLMVALGLGMGECLSLLRTARPVVCPNSGFAAQLRIFQKGSRIAELRSRYGLPQDDPAISAAIADAISAFGNSGELGLDMAASVGLDGAGADENEAEVETVFAPSGDGPTAGKPMG